jgi:hypothetical protein
VSVFDRPPTFLLLIPKPPTQPAPVRPHSTSHFRRRRVSDAASYTCRMHVIWAWTAPLIGPSSNPMRPVMVYLYATHTMADVKSPRGLYNGPFQYVHKGRLPLGGGGYL